MCEVCEVLEGEDGEDGELTLTLTPAALPTPDRRSVTGVVFARRRRAVAVALADVVVALADVVVAFVFVVPVTGVVDSFPFAFAFTLDPVVGSESTTWFWSC